MKLLDTFNRKTAGYKTYAAVVAIFAVGGLNALGFVDDNTLKEVLVFANALGLYGLRARK